MIFLNISKIFRAIPLPYPSKSFPTYHSPVPSPFDSAYSEMLAVSPTKPRNESDAKVQQQGGKKRHARDVFTRASASHL